MQKNKAGEVMLDWALTDRIGQGRHAIYANWNPREQSFEAWSRYRRSGQERKDRKRFIEALINRTTWKLLEDPQYYQIFLSFHRCFERKPPNDVIPKWHNEYSLKESKRQVERIFQKRTVEFPPSCNTPPQTYTYFERRKLESFNERFVFYEDGEEEIEDGLRRIADEL